MSEGQLLCDNQSTFALDAGALQAALTRFEDDGERRIARGSLVIDTVDTCDALSFYDVGYEEQRSSSSVLGDWFQIDPAPGANADDGTARGGRMVANLFAGRHQVRMLGLERRI